MNSSTDFNLSINSNAEGVSRELIEQASAIPNLQKQAISAGVQSLFVRSKMMLTQLIYQKDIPRVTRTRGSNKGRTVLAWRRKMRSGGLLGAETFFIAADGSEGHIETDPNSPAAKYAFARHELNRPSPIDGRTRAAPWRKRAKEEGLDDAVAELRRVLSEGLGR